MLLFLVILGMQIKKYRYCENRLNFQLLIYWLLSGTFPDVCEVSMIFMRFLSPRLQKILEDFESKLRSRSPIDLKSYYHKLEKELQAVLAMTNS